MKYSLFFEQLGSKNRDESLHVLSIFLNAVFIYGNKLHLNTISLRRHFSCNFVIFEELL